MRGINMTLATSVKHAEFRHATFSTHRITRVAMKPEDRRALQRLRAQQCKAKAKVEAAAVGTVVVLCTAFLMISIHIWGQA